MIIANNFPVGTIKYKAGICVLCILSAGYVLYAALPLYAEPASDVEFQQSKEGGSFSTFSSIGMKRRTQLVTKKCEEFQKHKSIDELDRNDVPPRPLICDNFKLIGCKAAKVASTNLQRIFYVLNGLTNDSDTGHVSKGAARKHTTEFFRKHHKNAFEELKDRLRSYKTFIFVRHPLERLVSAYRDHKPSGLFGKKKSIKFSDYVDRVLARSLRPHFSRPLRPLNMLCKPCQIQYDFVGSIDEFDKDISTILNSVRAENAVTIPKRNETGYKQKKSASVVENFYKDIAIDKIEKLENIYKDDYFLFGFERYSDIIRQNVVIK